MNPLAVIAGDPGGGNALAPVIEQLRAQHWPHRLFAYAESARLWAERGWLVEPAEAITLSNSVGVLCATSVNPHQHELSWIAAAKEVGLPSLALLDFWSNYQPRFLRGGQRHWPDCIAVPDQLACDEMVAAGFDASMLQITGQPALDVIAQGAGRLSTAARTALRAECGLQPDESLLLFVSQPLRQMARQLGHPPAIDEQAVLRDVEAALVTLARPIALRIKPHPREDLADFTGAGQMWTNTRIAPSALAHDLLSCADMVVGIHSMLLLEACYLGCRVLSYQPGGLASDPLPSNRSGLSHRCDDAVRLPQALVDTLTGPRPQAPSLDGLSAQRVLDVLTVLLA
ncbi:hypothetical protein [Chitinimonas sp. BJB300]|uniref:hypothetical protein n=1 Tax=Chitinimonas sp. BJB300 TaxID=1559339 RepID=UPI000C0CFD5B|nr:hypothetical protein [Chitinimonas sp. BJB300]PHV12483.1 hypothetical protein CSQ89_05475 [Chitinimonas sp. BJB300]TSJ89128.1 hypothetical protein FG002_009680 [Chitinimonas sp. BJB300]